MPDKGITNISYNFLNLPKQITQNGNTTNHIYRADGTKLHKKFTINGQEIDTDYLDEFVYTTPYSEEIKEALLENPDASLAGQSESLVLTEKMINPDNPLAQPVATPNFFPTTEGFYSFTENRYIYRIKDHLGNVRISFAKTTPELWK
jgi:hypothetical protein